MPLLEPDPGSLRPAAPHGPAPDRVPDTMAGGTPQPLRGELTALLGADKVLWKVSDLVRYASDASPYRFVPQVVVVAEDIDDISAVLSYAHGRGREVVFRAAGTSLNGQAQGEDILVDVRRHWAGIEVLDGGARARIRPGTTVVRANASLARHGRVLGPDPASAIACTIAPASLKRGTAAAAADSVGKKSSPVESSRSSGSVSKTTSEMKPKVPSEPTIRPRRICTGVAPSRKASSR
jgi:D-lactate dehydrogenase